MEQYISLLSLTVWNKLFEVPWDIYRSNVVVNFTSIYTCSPPTSSYIGSAFYLSDTSNVSIHNSQVEVYGTFHLFCDCAWLSHIILGTVYSSSDNCSASLDAGFYIYGSSANYAALHSITNIFTLKVCWFLLNSTISVYGGSCTINVPNRVSIGGSAYGFFYNDTNSRTILRCFEVLYYICKLNVILNIRILHSSFMVEMLRRPQVFLYYICTLSKCLHGI